MLKNTYITAIALIFIPFVVFSQNEYEIVEYFNSISICTDSSASSEDLDCVYLRVSYPQFKNPVYSQLNDLIKAVIFTNYFNDPYNNFDLYAKEFFLNYEKSQLEYKSPQWFHDISADSAIITDKIISISTGSYLYLGGAHGLGKSVTLNYDKVSSRILHLDDIFIADYESRLNKVINKRIKDELTKKGEFRIEKEIDFFNYENYAYDNLNKRFLLGQTSIIIILDYYDECYRMGAYTPIDIPYKMLSTLLNSDFIFLANQ